MKTAPSPSPGIGERGELQVNLKAHTGPSGAEGVPNSLMLPEEGTLHVYGTAWHGMGRKTKHFRCGGRAEEGGDWVRCKKRKTLSALATSKLGGRVTTCGVWYQ